MVGKREHHLSLLGWHSLKKHPNHFLPSFPAVGKVQLKSKWLCWIPRDSPHSTTLGKAPQLLQKCQSTTFMFPNYVTQPNTASGAAWEMELNKQGEPQWEQSGNYQRSKYLENLLILAAGLASMRISLLCAAMAT